MKMNREIKNLIEKIKHIKLSKKEKVFLRSKIEEFISWNPAREELDYMPKTGEFSIFTFRTLMKATAFSLIALIIVGGGGVAYAASDTLPGDKLYTVKINVSEKIETGLAIGSEAKLNVQTKIVERRLNEVQKLKKEDKLSDEKEKIVKDNIKKHVEDISKNIETLKEEGDVEALLETTSKLTPVLETHKGILEKDRQEKTKLEVNSFMAITTESEEENLKTDTASKKEVSLDEESLLDVVEKTIEKMDSVEKDTFEEIERNEKGSGIVAEKIVKKTGEKVISARVESDSSVKTDVDIEFDFESKIKEAEELLLQAEEAFKDGEVSRSISLSQKANKLLSEIEVYKKVKEIKNSEIKTELSETKEAEVENKEVTIPEEEPLELNTEEENTEEENVEVNENQIEEDIVEIDAENLLEETRDRLNLNKELETNLQANTHLSL